jgi:hypothetical protein
MRVVHRYMRVVHRYMAELHSVIRYLVISNLAFGKVAPLVTAGLPAADGPRALAGAPGWLCPLPLSSGTDFTER